MEIIVGIGNVFDDVKLGLCRCVTLLSQWCGGFGIGFTSENVYIPNELFLSADLRLGDCVYLAYTDGICTHIDKNGESFVLYDLQVPYGLCHGSEADFWEYE